MFNSIKRFFTGDKAAPKTAESRYDENGEYLFSEIEAGIMTAAHRLIAAQIIFYNTLKGNGAEKPAVILESKLITQWVIGYLCGVLDAACYIKTNGQVSHAPYEMQREFLSWHFAPELHRDLWACYIGATAVHDKPADPFYIFYERFVAGAQAGFSDACDIANSKPSMAFNRALMNGGMPEEGAKS